ncbi:MAG: glycosyltransferase, partial [Pseudomonadota bacterium]
IVLGPLSLRQFTNIFFKKELISIIPNFIDTENVLRKINSCSKSAVLQELNIQQGMPVITMIGRLVPGKRFDAFISILARCAETAKKKLAGLIIGDGPLRPELETLARKYSPTVDFHFLGYQRDVFKYLAVSDVFLFTTAHEVLPMALLEALSAGVPIVCSDIPQNRNIIQEGYNGYLAGAAEELYVDRILKILNNKNIAHALSAHGLEVAKTKFDKRIVLDETIKLYKKLMCQNSFNV